LRGEEGEQVWGWTDVDRIRIRSVVVVDRFVFVSISVFLFDFYLKVQPFFVNIFYIFFKVNFF
jgi:hypothetical protein